MQLKAGKSHGGQVCQKCIMILSLNCRKLHNKFFKLRFTKAQNERLPSVSPIHKQGLNNPGVKV